MARAKVHVAVRIVPYLVAILVAVGMLRASGALGSRHRAARSGAGAPARHPARGPADGALRPLSGSGAFAVMSETLKAYGPDLRRPRRQHASGLDRDDLPHVLAIYFGAVPASRDGRHAPAAADGTLAAGFAAAIIACHWLFGYVSDRMTLERLAPVATVAGAGRMR